MADESYDRPPQRRRRPPPPTDAAYEAASRHSGGSEDPAFYQQAVQGVLNRHPAPEGDDYDEDQVPEHHRPVRQEEADSAERVHREIYEQGGGAPQGHHSAEDVGQAAALHAFQMHQQQQQEQGQQEEGGGGGGGGGGGMQDLMGMAMGEATNLFNAGGGQGDKMAMVQSAAMMAMKIYMSQQQQQSGGGGLGGMLGGLMGGGGGGGGGMMMGMLSKMM